MADATLLLVGAMLALVGVAFVKQLGMIRRSASPRRARKTKLIRPRRTVLVPESAPMAEEVDPEGSTFPEQEQFGECGSPWPPGYFPEDDALRAAGFQIERRGPGQAVWLDRWGPPPWVEYLHGEALDIARRRLEWLSRLAEKIQRQEG